MITAASYLWRPGLGLGADTVQDLLKLFFSRVGDQNVPPVFHDVDTEVTVHCRAGDGLKLQRLWGHRSQVTGSNRGHSPPQARRRSEAAAAVGQCDQIHFQL